MSVSFAAFASWLAEAGAATEIGAGAAAGTGAGATAGIGALGTGAGIAGTGVAASGELLTPLVSSSVAASAPLSSIGALGTGAGIAGTGVAASGALLPEAVGAFGVPLGVSGAGATAGGGLSSLFNGPLTMEKSLALNAGSQLVSSLLTPKVPSAPQGLLQAESKKVTPMPVAPGAAELARNEQDLVRRRGMGRGYTSNPTLSDMLG